MKKFNLLFLLLFIFCLITACGETAKYLRNEKTITTDEFLVKKKDPLTLPPDFESLPKPDQEVRSKELKTSIKETLKGTSIEEVDDSAASVSSAEESILNKIKLK